MPVRQKITDCPFLILDLQTTGANPSFGSVIEVAWAISNGPDPSGTIENLLVKLPENETIPRRIKMLTGISEESLENADPCDAVFGQLKEVTDNFPFSPIPTVIHFARFELPFLTNIYTRLYEDSNFPFRLFCTHEISKRLFPQLPRHGLRAVAGHLGHTVPECRRAAEHVAATQSVWSELCKEFVRQKIVHLRDLDALLATKSPSRQKDNFEFSVPKEKRSALPTVPGIYRFLDRNSHVLYVGKATNLKTRVASYFAKKGYRAATTLEMLTQAFDLKITVTDTPLEAAMLEVFEIQTLAPPYNTALRIREYEDSRNVLKAFATLMARREETDEQLAQSLGEELGLNFRGKPCAKDLFGGAQLFAESFCPTGNGDSPDEFRLLAFGNICWWNAVVDDVEDDDDTEEEEFEWTPLRVAKGLRGVVKYAALRHRRKFWYRLLRNSTIEFSWTGKSKKETEKIRTLSVSTLAKIETELDHPATTRLGVLSSELGRLMSNGFPVKITTETGEKIHGDRLRLMLNCV